MDKINQILDSVESFINSIDPSYINIAAYVVMGLTVLFVALIVNDMIKQEQEEHTTQRSFERGLEETRANINRGLKKSSVKIFNYDEIKSYISRSGLGYMSNGKVTPLVYVGMKFTFAIFFLLFGLRINLIAGLVLLPIGYMGLDFIVNESDKDDNKKMLTDIKNIYDTLRIQTKAGVYITSVLTECYLVAHNKRLKAALLKLTSDIIAKSDIEEALDEFKNKFNNEYLDTLVVIIKQSMKTGQAAKMFDDIKDQIKDIDAALAVNEKAKINAKTVMVQILMYSAIIITAVFITFTALSSGLDM